VGSNPAIPTRGQSEQPIALFYFKPGFPEKFYALIYVLVPNPSASD
jgi:hypothetical protein